MAGNAAGEEHPFRQPRRDYLLRHAVPPPPYTTMRQLPFDAGSRNCIQCLGTMARCVILQHHNAYRHHTNKMRTQNTLLGRVAGAVRVHAHDWQSALGGASAPFACEGPPSCVVQVLLRARAIETQCYVAAAAQVRCRWKWCARAWPRIPRAQAPNPVASVWQAQQQAQQLRTRADR